MTTTIFTPTHVANVALDWCAAQETRDALLCSMTWEHHIVAMMRVDGYTWEEIGEAFGVSCELPRQWMAKAAVNAYNKCPELREMLRSLVTLCPFCGRAKDARYEVCRRCSYILRTTAGQRHCVDCDMVLRGKDKSVKRCRSCYLEHVRNGG